MLDSTQNSDGQPSWLVQERIKRMGRTIGFIGGAIGSIGAFFILALLYLRLDSLGSLLAGIGVALFPLWWLGPWVAKAAYQRRWFLSLAKGLASSLMVLALLTISVVCFSPFKDIWEANRTYLVPLAVLAFGSIPALTLGFFSTFAIYGWVSKSFPQRDSSFPNM